MKKMSGGLIALIVVLVIIFIIVVTGISSFNGVVTLNENVDTQKSQIDNQLQRQADLIPNIVNTVKGYTQHETAAIKAVTDARAKLAGANTTEEKLAASDDIKNNLEQMKTDISVIVENYPDLKANTQFTGLMDELSGTANRIAVARMDYNNAVKAYNSKIRTFPTNLFAGLFGFDKANYFEASSGASSVPGVDFSSK